MASLSFIILSNGYCGMSLLLILLGNRRTYLCLDFLSQLWVVFQQCLGGITTLTELGAIIAEPAAALLDDVVLNTQIHDLAYLADALAEGNLKLSLAEWRSHLVLDHLHSYQVAYHIVTILDG